MFYLFILLTDKDDPFSTGKEPEDPNSSRSHVKHEMIEEEKSDDDDEHADYEHADYYYSRFANYLTGEEREEIFSLVSLQPGNPVFVTVLQAPQIHRKGLLVSPIIHLSYDQTKFQHLRMLTYKLSYKVNKLSCKNSLV